MATELEPPPAGAVPGAAPLEAEEDEEHWLYGDDTTGKQEDGPISGHAESSHPLQDAPQENRPASSEDREMSQHALPSGEDDEEDSDSDSDDDDVKVTIGNIKTGAPSYIGGFSLMDCSEKQCSVQSVTSSLDSANILCGICCFHLSLLIL